MFIILNAPIRLIKVNTHEIIQQNNDPNVYKLKIYISFYFNDPLVELIKGQNSIVTLKK